MSGIGMAGVSAPQSQELQAAIAAQIRQPAATAQADAIKTVNAAAGQMAATLASISSGVNIQV
jgi:hypothetical protein